MSGKTYEIVNADCLAHMKTIADNSIDSIISDPPYGLLFMGKEWDHGVPGKEFWIEALRIAKPGAYILAFGGTRTYHRLTVAIEDAGWEIRDCLSWLYGSGFPKSHNIAKAIEAQIETGSSSMSAQRKAAMGDDYKPTEMAGTPDYGNKGARYTGTAGQGVDLKVSSDAAKQWNGFGTALKPAWEPIVMARKPMGQTVASNVLQHGTGGINIDGCRIGGGQKRFLAPAGNTGLTAASVGPVNTTGYKGQETTQGRWPANILFDEEAAKMLDEQSGESKSTGIQRKRSSAGIWSEPGQGRTGDLMPAHGDSGGASRFFYVAKPSKAERNAGLEGAAVASTTVKGNGLNRRCATCDTPQLQAKDCKCEVKDCIVPAANQNSHPTVKPIELMRYLCRLVTPPGGVVLDPFVGSGTTGCGAVLEGFKFIGIEKSADYAKIALGRLDYWASKGATDKPVKKLLPKKAAKPKAIKDDPPKKKKPKKHTDNLTLDL